MRLDQPADQIIQQIHHLDRAACIRELRMVPRLRLDFSDDYLARLSLEQLRHVLVAACLQARKPPPGRS